MGRVEHLVEKQRRAGRGHDHAPLVTPVPADAVASEWRPAPLGRLGRALWTDIDRYLEFVAIARSEPHARGREATPVRSTGVTILYLRFR